MCSALSQKTLLTGVISQSHEKLNTSVAVSGDPPGRTKGLLNAPLLLQGSDCTDGCRRYLGGGVVSTSSVVTWATAAVTHCC